MLFNLRRLQAKSKVRLCHGKECLKRETIDQVSQTCDNYDLKIGTETTEVVYQPAQGKPYSEPQWMDKDCKSMITSSTSIATCSLIMG